MNLFYKKQLKSRMEGFPLKGDVVKKPEPNETQVFQI